MLQLRNMRKLLALSAIVLLTLLHSLPSFGQGVLSDKRFTPAFNELKKIHFDGSRKQEEVAKSRKLTDAEIFCMYEGQVIDSINISSLDIDQFYTFNKKGYLTKYQQEGEFAHVVHFNGNRLTAFTDLDTNTSFSCVYVPLGDNTYRLELRGKGEEKPIFELDSAMIKFNNAGQIVSIRSQNGRVYSYNYDKFGNARNDKGQLCIPILDNEYTREYGYFHVCTNLILRNASMDKNDTSEENIIDKYEFGSNADGIEGTGLITLFIRDFDARAGLAVASLF